MIRDLDTSLEQMLAGEATLGSELASATISFGAPDEDWRSGGSGLSLDIYLYKVLENRELRTNEQRTQRSADGTVTSEQWPIRLECTYLITAWNKEATVGPVEKEKQEHRLLSQVLYVLWRNPTLPSKYLSGLLTNTQEISVPVITAQSDDLALVPDFWTGFGTYLRPAITCRVTISLNLDLDVTGPMVTSLDISTGQADIGGGADEQLVFGGTVRSSATGTPPVAGAWVMVVETGRVYVTDDDGHYLVTGVSRGNYSLAVRAVGFVPGSRAIVVPQPDGFYDVTLTPL